jgi:hypothetical protein
VNIRGFTLGIKFNAFPTNEASYRDSAYTLWLCASKYASECTGRWPGLFQSLNLDSLVLEYQGIKVIANPASIERFSPCHTYWYYQDAILPEGLDTLRMHLHFTHTDDDQLIALDTIITLYRIQAKYREMMSW